MPIRMTEIPPQTPIGAVKVSIDVKDIVAETSFDAELALIEGFPVEAPSETHDFIPIGQILREVFPLKVRFGQAPVESLNLPTEPLNIEAKQVAIHSAFTEATPDMPQQSVTAQNVVTTKIPPTKEVENSPQEAEASPLEPAVNANIPDNASIHSITEKPSAPENAFIQVVQSNAPRTEMRTNPASERQSDSKRDFVPTQNNVPSNNSARQSVVPALPDAVPRVATIPTNGISSEMKLQTTTEAHRDPSDLGGGISEKLQLLRPLPTATPALPPTAVQPHPAETKVLSQISSAISNTSKDTVEIRLDPPELGRVIISITHSDSGLNATITSEKAEIADLLRRHAELLSRELSKSGFGEPSLEFSHGGQHNDRSDFEESKDHFSPAGIENSEAASMIERALQSQSGSLDIRL